METKQIVLLAVRVLQLICACVVLGTSADLAKFFDSTKVQDLVKLAGISLDNLVSILDFGAFTGAWGLLDSLLGLAIVFVAAIPWIAVVVMDALACIFYFASATAAAVWFSKGNHSDNCDLVGNDKCTKGEADTAFAYIGFVTTLVLIALGFMWQRKGVK